MTEPRMLDDWISSYMQYAKATEPPTSYHLWSAISLISACMQRKCKFPFGALTFYPNMYIALVGPPAARKGTAMNIAFPFLEKLNVKVAAEAITREALIKELQMSSDNDLDLTTGKRTFHCSLTIWSQELAVFLGYNQMQLISDLTDWYDCKNKWTYRTKTMGTDEIVGVYVNLFGAITPDLIRATMPIDAIGGGLTSRIIFIFEWDKEKVVPFTSLDSDLYPGLLHDLEQVRMMSGDFSFTSEMKELWIEWYTHHEEQLPFKDCKFDGYFQRRGNHVLKLSMIMSASRSNDMLITSSDLERAIMLLCEAEKNMANTFSGVGRAAHADVLAKIMAEISMAGTRGLRASELLTMHRGDTDALGIERIINTLETMKFVEKKIYPDDTLLIYTGQSIRGLY